MLRFSQESNEVKNVIQKHLPEYGQLLLTEHINRRNITSEELLSIFLSIWETLTFLQRGKVNEIGIWSQNQQGGIRLQTRQRQNEVQARGQAKGERKQILSSLRWDFHCSLTLMLHTPTGIPTVCKAKRTD